MGEENNTENNHKKYAILLICILSLLLFCCIVYLLKYRFRLKYTNIDNDYVEPSRRRNGTKNFKTPEGVKPAGLRSMFSTPAPIERDIPLTKLETPLPNQGNGNRRSIGIFGKNSIDQPLLQYRPFDTQKLDDYYGIITVTDTQSGHLTVSSHSTNDYFEVVIYKYPTWTVAYAETNISELDLDFLEKGNYVIIVFAVEPVEGYFSIIAQNNRKRPVAKNHRLFQRKLANAKDENAERIIYNHICGGSSELFRISSNPAYIWPGAIFTRVETLYFSTPIETTEIFITVPSYGFIVEGANEHLGTLLHEGDSVSIYRAIAKYPWEAGGSGASKDNEKIATPPSTEHSDMVVSITVVYPNIDPDSEATISPSLRAFIFGLPTATGSHWA
jgi:hypothetical protein